MQFVKGPDFPTSALILGTKGIRSAYETGRGQITIQAQSHIETLDAGKAAIIITEIPYQVNKQTLQEKIGALVREKKVDGITAMYDYSDRHGIRIQIELRRDAHPKKVLNHLLKHTELRKTFGVIMLALVDGVPRVLNLRQVMQRWIDHRVEIIVRRTRIRIAKSSASRAHPRRLAYRNRVPRRDHSHHSRVVQPRRGAKPIDEPVFGLSQIQATAILDMQFRQLTALEREKIEEEFKGLLKRIAALEDLLSDPLKILGVIKDELKFIKDKFGDQRKTRIVPMEAKRYRGRRPDPGRTDHYHHHPRWLYQTRADRHLSVAEARGQGDNRGHFQGRGQDGAAIRRDDPPLHPLLHRQGPGLPP